MTTIRRIERLLWLILGCIFVTTVLVGTSIDDPTDHRVVEWTVPKSPNLMVTQHQFNSTTSTESVLRDTPTNGFNLWRDNSNIPDWMKEYMDWHRWVVSTLTPENWDDHRYLILRCYRKDERCGGVSDRLKPVPLMILAAQRSNRILFIDWDRPCALTEFLVPPVGGFQWNAPEFLINIMQSNRTFLIFTRAANLIEKCQQPNPRMIHAHIHDSQGGGTQYDDEYGKGAFLQIYHDLFRIFFQPSPAIQRLVDLYLIPKDDHPENHDKATTTTTTGKPVLREGQYTVAHYRAEYGREIARHPKLTEPSFLRRIAVNAIRCATDLKPGAPIYFASDNVQALETAKSLAKYTKYPIITFKRSEDTPLRLDTWNGSYVPSDYYSTFVDLYLAGSGDCVAHGRGGFGRFAAMLSYNVTCSYKHVKQFFPVRCVGQPPFRDGQVATKVVVGQDPNQ